ncbi:MAG: twin-arginine translocase TatA/TatE family subunit [Planctomycetes bacterium]|nr:twin-arginine translocase TatA/TatE family subunit [Planctomycetota bacterium]
MLGTTELWIILVVAFLLFGGSQIPRIARALGQAKKEFQVDLKEGERDEKPVEPEDTDKGKK